MQTERSSFSYAVFRYVKDAMRDISVPIGVALWSADANWMGVRLVRPDEKLPKISRRTDTPFIDVFERKLSEWLSSGQVPYGERSLTPTSDAWWSHLQKLLVHKVRVSEPRPIDCSAPERDIELLFKEVVGDPLLTDENVRIDHLITRSLGASLSKSLRRGEIKGYADKPVQVMRLFSGTQAIVVLEGVNLALENAASEADALVGKLQRARANGSANPRPDREIIAIVGYLASEEGLNGEAFLKEWIEKAGQAKALDVEREASQLRTETERALAYAGPPPALQRS